jgi:hypothetical protein
MHDRVVQPWPTLVCEVPTDALFAAVADVVKQLLLPAYARALATAATRTSDAAIREELCAALSHAEDHLRFSHHVAGDYGKDAEVRAQIVDVIRAPVIRC